MDEWEEKRRAAKSKNKNKREREVKESVGSLTVTALTIRQLDPLLYRAGLFLEPGCCAASSLSFYFYYFSFLSFFTYFFIVFSTWLLETSSADSPTINPSTPHWYKRIISDWLSVVNPGWINSWSRRRPRHTNTCLPGTILLIIRQVSIAQETTRGTKGDKKGWNRKPTKTKQWSDSYYASSQQIMNDWPINRLWRGKRNKDVDELNLERNWINQVSPS